LPDQTVALDRDDMRRTLVRIAHEIIEKNPPQGTGEASGSESQSGPGFAIVGVHRRGAVLARRLHALTSELTDVEIPFGTVDISFYRDDLGLRGRGPGAMPVVHSTQLDFTLDNRTIVIVDDVLYTGRTARSAIDVLFDYGRPARVQLAVLVDRGHRELPIRPDYVGKNLPTARDQRVNVHVEEIDGSDEVTIGPATDWRP
jgi:pyrimidine operon attenuation protein / uracil phosphoribosyltransferase